MKKVNLIGPTIVRAGGEQSVRHPHENPIEVSDAEADRLHDAGSLLEAPSAAATKPATAKPKRASNPARAAQSEAAAPAPAPVDEAASLQPDD